MGCLFFLGLRLHLLCTAPHVSLKVQGLLLPPLQMDPQEAQIAALKREVFLLRQENSYLRDQVGPYAVSLYKPSLNAAVRQI